MMSSSATGRHRDRRATTALAVALTGLLALTACSSDGDTTASSAPAASDGVGGSSVETSVAPSGTTGGSNEDKLAALMKSTSEAPGGDPLPIVKDKSMFIVSCGQALLVCSEPIAGAEEAAEEVGWKTTLFDTQGDAVKFAQGVSQGIAAQADAILLMSIDCSLVKSQVEQALEAGIEIMTMQSVDCDDAAGGGGPSLYDGREPKLPGFDTFANWSRNWSAEKLVWVSERTGGTGRVLHLIEPTYPIYQTIREGVETGLEKFCPGCTSTEMEFTFDDGPAVLQQRIQQALLKDPEINVILAPDDGTVLSGVSAAVVAAGKQNDVLVVGGEGSEPSLDLIRSDRGQSMALAYDLKWFGWAAVDSLNSRFQGKELRESGLGYQLIDATNVPSSPGAYTSPVDYRAEYRRLWGLG
jgi:ribose transport system substrate-binding protein